MLAVLLSLFAITSDAWLKDFHQLMHEISTHYANLDSAISDRRLDLPDLKKRTEEALRNAKNDDEARQALDRFMREFGDGHVSIRWPSQTASTDDSSKPLCERLRYRARDVPGIDFARLDNFQGGIVTLDKNRRLGIIRIPTFSGDIHPEICKDVQSSLGLADDAPCDFECEIKIRRAVDDRMTVALEHQLASLEKAGATAIAVDVTGNGGGSDWVEAAARVLTPVPLKSPRLGFIKHPHWVKILDEQLADVEHDLANNVEPKALLAEARETLRRARAAAAETCDRSMVWEGKTPDCSLIVKGALYASGVLPHAKRETLPRGRSTNVLFNPAQFTYDEGANRLPLYVLVDGRTGSAAELFAAMLKDNGAATLIGAPTAGLGCGHINGGVWATLENSRGRVQLPDCSRFRADGTNEVTSVVPDILVPWRNSDSRYQRAKKTVEVLEATVEGPPSFSRYFTDSPNIRTVVVGELPLPTGELVVADPFTSGPALQQRVPAGNYKLTLAIARLETWGERVAFARLQFSERPVIRWELAGTFPVDAGLTLLADRKSATLLAEAQRRFKGNYYDDVLARELPTATSWTLHRPDRNSPLTVAILSSGLGDGLYSSYWGLDRDGNLAQLVTDFQLFSGDEEP